VGYRVIMNFGIQQRARQYLLASVLKVVADLYPDQYLTRGGVPAAIDRVTSLLKEGYTWTIEIDITNCYPSFTGTHLEKYIPVKTDVIANAILATHLNVTPGHSLHYHFGPGSAGEDDPGDPVEFSKVLSDARQGIPQGSAVASIAVEMLLAEPLKSLPGDARVVCYADNMLVMAKSEENAVSIAKALWSALEAHPVGHLKPKLKGYSSPGQPFDFLGHRITPTKSSVNITPSQKNEDEFYGRLKKDLAAIKKPLCSNSRRKLIADELKDYVTSWTASFSRCNGMANRRQACLLQIHNTLELAQAGAKEETFKWLELLFDSPTPPKFKLNFVKFPRVSGAHMAP
jgi:hypothetical protein